MSQTTDPKRHLLWVDDEIEFLRAHILFLEDQGWQVDKATNGYDAIALAGRTTYDIVILDEQMAGLDGLSTLEQLKKAHPQLFVIMVTKSEEERLMEEAVGRKIDGYLTKPVNPNQIVSLCRSLFTARSMRVNHFTSRYVRQYAENKAKIQSPTMPSDWEAIHTRLAQWDIELAAGGQEGLLETHTGQKEETETAFIRFVEENWFGWMGRGRFKPNFVWDFMPRRAIPAAKAGDRQTILLLSGLRTDQWLAMQSLLEGLFDAKLEHQWSILPSVPETARLSLLGGATPRQLAEADVAWKWPDRAAVKTPDFLGKVFQRALATHGAGLRGSIEHAATAKDIRRISSQAAFAAADLSVLVVEYGDLLDGYRQSRTTGEPTPIPMAEYREHARRLLAASGLYHLFRKLAQLGRQVVVVSDHGSTPVTEPIEVYCAEEQPADFRMQFGEGISCDERHAFFIENPIAAALDSSRGPLAIAKGERFFTHPNKYQYYGNRHVGRLVSGGISMNEMLVPLCLLTPR